MDMVLTILLIFGVAILVFFLGLAAGKFFGKKEAKNDFTNDEVRIISKLFLGYDNASILYRQDPGKYLNSIEKVWLGCFNHVYPPRIVNIYSSGTTDNPKGLGEEWIAESLARLNEGNFIWLEKSDTSLNGKKRKKTAAFQFLLQEEGNIKIIVVYLPEIPNEKKLIYAKLFTDIENNVQQRRNLTVFSNTLEQVAANNELKFKRMWRLFSTLDHNLRNVLSTFLGHLNRVMLLHREQDKNREKIYGILEDKIYPKLPIVQNIISSLSITLSTLMVGEKNFTSKKFQLSSLFNKHFSAWLKIENREWGGGKFIWDIPHELYVDVPEIVFFQIVWNVLRNAKNYSRPGFENIVNIDAVIGQDDRVYLRVKDKGIGISETDIEKIGDYKFRGSGEEITDGEGLGLWGIYRFMDHIGGTIEIRSDEGMGSTFSLGFVQPKEVLKND